MINLVFKPFLFLVVYFSSSFYFSISAKDGLGSEALLDSIQVMDLIEKSKISMGLDYKQAMSLALEAEGLAYQLKHPRLKLEADLNIGKLFFYLGLYPESFEYTNRAVKIAEDNQDDLGLAKGYFQFGSLRLVMEDYAKAQDYIVMARDFFLKHYGEEDKIELLSRVTMHNNLGLIFTGLANFQKAEDELRKGISLLNEKSSLNTVAVQLFNNLGDLYREYGRIDEAISFYFVAKNKLDEDSNLLFDAMLDNSLGLSYLELGKLDSAMQVFHHGLSKAKAAKGYSHIHHLSKSLSNFHEQTGNKDSAFVYLSQSKMYEDSLNLKNTAENLLKEELLSEFRAEKNQLLGLYEKNKNSLFTLIICLLLVSIGFYTRAIYVKKNLEMAELEKDKLAQDAEKALEETVALKRKVENTQKELTFASMQAIQRDEILRSLTKKLSKNDNLKEDVSKILNGLRIDQTEISLSDFELRFSGVYIGFFEKLMEEYPSLSHNERRLSAFLKLQLTTKEIAVITGQSIRAIEMGRTRLRKKLNLTNSEVNLYDFFVDY